RADGVAAARDRPASRRVPSVCARLRFRDRAASGRRIEMPRRGSTRAEAPDRPGNRHHGRGRAPRPRGRLTDPSGTCCSLYDDGDVRVREEPSPLKIIRFAALPLTMVASIALTAEPAGAGPVLDNDRCKWIHHGDSTLM